MASLGDYSSLTKEELIQLIKRRDAERTRYGLVWERDEIEYDKALNVDFVAFNLIQELSVGESPWDHILIEGENFDALRYLRMALAGRIKVVFVDPPYNTGHNDFIYNDSYVDGEDTFRHSKWLEFMYRRLLIAKDLLSEDGVIFINIGEDEFANLTLLMEKVFPGRKVTTFVWKRRIGASDEAGYNVSTDHEYVVCFANPGFSFTGGEKDFAKYSNPDNDPRGPWMSADLTKAHTYLQRPNTYYPIFNPASETWYPCNPNNVWRFSSLSRIKPGQKIRSKPIEELIEDGKILFPENDRTIVYQTMQQLLDAIHEGTAPTVLNENLPDIDFWVGRKMSFGRPRYKRHLSEMKRNTKPLSTLLATATEKIPIDHETEYLSTGYTQEGTKLLANILGQKIFDYPKPLSLIKNLIAQSTSPNGGDIILDFFAGSGTTAHAVMELNSEDDGDRRFIMVSSTEATLKEPDKNICRDVTRLRLKRVIEGYSYKTGRSIKSVEGLAGGFAYFNMNRILPESIRINIRHDQVWLALQLIHTNVISPFTEEKQIQIVENSLGEVICYSITVNDETVEALDRLVHRYPSVVCYSWQPGLIEQYVFSPKLSVQKIPDFIVERFGGGDQ